MAADTPDNPGPAAPGRPAATGPLPGAAPAGIPGARLDPILVPAFEGEVVPLLIKAVGLLPEAERDQVYGWLLERGLGAPPTRLARPLRVELLAQEPSGRPAAPAGGQQVVPVRFPADQHAELRGWCTDHGFSMATVIRGLVSRFLDGQLRAEG